MEQTSKSNGVSILSIISIVVSITATVIYAQIFENNSLIPLFILFGIISIILPPIAKAIRISKNKTGGWMEIIAIIIGGFNFYFIIFALSTLPLFIGYLGWVICGIVYKCIKSPREAVAENNIDPNTPTWTCRSCGNANTLNVSTCQYCGVTKAWSDSRKK